MVARVCVCTSGNWRKVFFLLTYLSNDSFLLTTKTNQKSIEKKTEERMEHKKLGQREIEKNKAYMGKSFVNFFFGSVIHTFSGYECNAIE